MENAFLGAKALVEKVIGDLGVDAVAARAKSDAKSTAGREEHANWTLQRGSAAMLVSVVDRGGDVHVRVISPLMTLPDPAKHEALFRHLLELNAGGLGGVAFALVNERIVAVTERSARGLDPHELDHMIRHTGVLADTYDDRLVSEFGGKLASDKS